MKDTRYQFSEELRIKARKIFEEEAGHSISMEQVDMSLDRLNQLGMLFVKNVEQGNTKIDAELQS
jgi:hypothetical protein